MQMMYPCGFKQFSTIFSPPESADNNQGTVIMDAREILGHFHAFWLRLMIRSLPGSCITDYEVPSQQAGAAFQLGPRIQYIYVYSAVREYDRRDTLFELLALMP